MSAREIKELRLAGRLEEALAMASDCLEADPNNIWNKRAIVWVLYEYLKKNIEEKSFEQVFAKTFNRILLNIFFQILTNDPYDSLPVPSNVRNQLTID